MLKYYNYTQKLDKISYKLLNIETWFLRDIVHSITLLMETNAKTKIKLIGIATNYKKPYI